MLKEIIHLKATIYIGSQKREFPLYEFTDDELVIIMEQIKKLWNNNLIDISIHYNIPENTSIHLECYDGEVELDSLIRFEAPGEWLEKQNLYVKFSIEE